MATGTYAPWFLQQYFDDSGNPLNGGTLEVFIAGTTTHAAVYSDVGLTTAYANPLTLNSAGRLPSNGSMFLSPGASYKIVVKTSAGVTISTPDNILAVPGSQSGVDVIGTAGEAITAGQPTYLSAGTGGKTAGLWYIADSTNTYSSTIPIVGMALASIASGGSGTIRLSGSVTGLVSLTVGARYYIGVTGAITVTAPANARILGDADTTSTLVLTNSPPPSVIIGTANQVAYYSTTAAIASQAGMTFTSQNFINSSTQPRCSVVNSAVQSIPNATSTPITWDTETFDVGVMHSTSVNSSRITVPTGGDGLYLVVGSVGFAGGAGTQRQVTIFKNGATVANAQFAPSASYNPAQSVVALMALVATDYVEVAAYQDSGGALNTNSAASGQTYFSVVKLW